VAKKPISMPGSLLKRLLPSSIKNLSHFLAVLGFKQHLFGVFRGLKYGRTFLEFSGALNSQNYVILGA
jgi:hypothetical protein